MRNVQKIDPRILLFEQYAKANCAIYSFWKEVSQTTSYG